MRGQRPRREKREGEGTKEKNKKNTKKKKVRQQEVRKKSQPENEEKGKKKGGSAAAEEHLGTKGEKKCQKTMEFQFPGAKPR